MKAKRCRFRIETKEHPQARVVLTRRACKNRTTRPSGLCWQHDPEWAVEWMKKRWY